MPGLPPAIFNCKKSICIMLFVKKKKKKKNLEQYVKKKKKKISNSCGKL